MAMTNEEVLENLRRELELRETSLKREIDLRFEAQQKMIDLRLDSLQREMNLRFKEIDVRFDAQQKSFDARFDMIDKELQALRERLGLHTASIAEQFRLTQDLISSSRRNAETLFAERPTFWQVIGGLSAIIGMIGVVTAILSKFLR